jgi:adenine deaminase
MIVVGTDRTQMALAANRLAEVGGGVTVLRDGAGSWRWCPSPSPPSCPTPTAREVAAKAQGLVDAMEACGCRLNNAYMQHSLLALVVIPELRLSDKGLVDVRRFEVTSLWEGNE